LMAYHFVSCPQIDNYLKRADRFWQHRWACSLCKFLCNHVRNGSQKRFHHMALAFVCVVLLFVCVISVCNT
jgi:hypothetical protein